MKANLAPFARSVLTRLPARPQPGSPAEEGKRPGVPGAIRTATGRWREVRGHTRILHRERTALYSEGGTPAPRTHPESVPAPAESRIGGRAEER